MSLVDVVMPQLGETVTEGTVVEWKFRAGDRVPADSVLFDVESDKATIEVPTPAEGVLTSVLVKAGEAVPVGTVLAQLEVASGGVAEHSVHPKTERPEPARGKCDGPDGDDRDRGVQGAAGGRTRDVLSPAVRQLLAQHRLDAAGIERTGRDGRLTKSDVLAFIERRKHEAPSQPQRTDTPDASGNAVPFNRYRKLTAEHMVRSKATSPHVLQAMEVDFNAVQGAREWWHASGGADILPLSILPFVAFAACRALGDYPALNASVEGEGLRLHPKVNLAIAVDLNHRGLVAPVIRGASDLDLAELARALTALAAKARSGTLLPDEIRGGTYTISNSGGYGTYLTAPIINQPQVAILSLDGVRKRPVVVSDEDADSIEIRPVGILAQCFDHRAVDGAYSAAFLRTLKGILEEHDWLSVIKGIR